MSRRTTTVAVITLALIAVGALLFYLNSPRSKFALAPPPTEFPACKYAPRVGRTCLNQCGSVPGFPPFTEASQPVQATINGETFHYCCPKGTTFMVDGEKCKVDPHAK